MKPIATFQAPPATSNRDLFPAMPKPAAPPIDEREAAVNAAQDALQAASDTMCHWSDRLACFTVFAVVAGLGGEWGRIAPLLALAAALGIAALYCLVRYVEAGSDWRARATELATAKYERRMARIGARR